jgi:hypothetical protein
MSKVFAQNAEILEGEPVFKGTRVPVERLFDHLEGRFDWGFFRRVPQREAGTGRCLAGSPRLISWQLPHARAAG